MTDLRDIYFPNLLVTSSDHKFECQKIRMSKITSPTDVTDK